MDPAHAEGWLRIDDIGACRNLAAEGGELYGAMFQCQAGRHEGAKSMGSESPLPIARSDRLLAVFDPAGLYRPL